MTDARASLGAVGMFVYSDAEHDARVWREAATLADNGFSVTIFATSIDGSPSSFTRHGVEMRRLPTGSQARPGSGRSQDEGAAGRATWLWQYLWGLEVWERRAADAAASLGAISPEPIWHGHDLTGLGAAARAQRRYGGKLIYDSHELFLDANTVSRLPAAGRKLVRQYEKRLIRRADAVITVNDLLASELATRYAIQVPTVVMNCPPLGAAPADRLLSPMRTELGLADRPVVLYHGGITEARVLSSVEALDFLDRSVALVLLGAGFDKPWLGTLTHDRRLHNRLFTHSPVPFANLQEWVAGADVGVMAIRNTMKNHYLSTPNKLFECMNAGVPVVASDFPAMREIVTGFDIGKLCDPAAPREIARAIEALLGEPAELRAARRARCRVAAEERYNWELESRRLLDTYAEVANQ